jgi:hypothetical protein
MTLIEVLMAVVILLVGVYTVAGVFPLLQRQIVREGQREQGARAAESAIAEWKAAPEGIPLWTTESPSLATGALMYRTGEVSCVSDNEPAGCTFLPRDPTEAVPGAEVDPVRNPLKDLRDVIGERVKIQAPTAPLPGLPTLAPYLLRLGPADPTTIAVWERLEYSPGVRGALQPGQFAVDPTTGDVQTVPLPGTTDASGNGFIDVDYCWIDTVPSLGLANMTYGFQGEVVQVTTSFGIASGRVAPLRNGYGGSIVPGTMRVWGLRPFTQVAWGATPAPGEYAVSPPGSTAEPLGAVLYFNVADAGRVVDVSYRRRDWSILSEDHTVPSYEPHGVRLEAAPLWVPDPANPIPEKDSLYPASGGVLVAAFDMTDGTYLTDRVELSGQGDALYERGQVTLGPSRAGHRIRFFYRARDNRAKQVICAGRSYVPLGDSAMPLLSHAVPPGGVEPAALDQARGYVLRPASALPPIPGVSSNAWVLLFRPSEAGKAVVVTYTTPDSSGRPVKRRWFAQVRTEGINHAGSVWHPAVLGPAQPAAPLTLWAINSVNGASVKVRVWWTDDKGRYQRADADGFLAPADV